jgi:hypothetical protein
LSGSRALWNTSNCSQPASCREISQRAFIACASSVPLPGTAWNVTTSRTAMAFPPVPQSCLNQYHDPPAAVTRKDIALFRRTLQQGRSNVPAFVKSGRLAQPGDAVRCFSTLAGPVINGYAFCDLAKQAELHSKAVDWVENNPD